MDKHERMIRRVWSNMVIEMPHLTIEFARECYWDIEGRERE